MMSLFFDRPPLIAWIGLIVLAMGAMVGWGLYGPDKTYSVNVTIALSAQKTASASLPAAPMRELVEETENGSLPTISAEGVLPWQAYAAPYAQQDPAEHKPIIGIIVTGLGIRQETSSQALDILPSQVSIGFSPFSTDLQSWIDRARSEGHEPLLMLPMEPLGFPQNDPGPGTLLVAHHGEENLLRLHRFMARGTGYFGMIAEMGERFSRHQKGMDQVLQELSRRGLAYIDLGHPGTLAEQIAQETGTAFAGVNLQIDRIASPDSIAAALAELEEIAVKDGFALGLAYPYPVTLSSLREWAAGLEESNVRLVPASYVVRERRKTMARP